MSREQKLDPLAAELNQRLEAAAPEVAAMLSALGRRLYFPKGILSQGAEAKQKAHRANATIGIATEGGAPMVLPSMACHTDIDPADAFNYAPPAGRRASGRRLESAPAPGRHRRESGQRRRRPRAAR